MTVSVGQAIYTALAASSDVTTRLATWHGSPAIFTLDDAPDDAPRPYVVSPAALERVRDLDLDDPPLQSVSRQVFIFGDRPDPGGDLDVLADLAATALEGLSIEGAVMSGVQVAGPTGLDPSRQDYGRSITVDAFFTEV